jgi:hemerythrin
MPTVIETTVYQFDELSDEAKQKARDWYREASAGDTYHADAVVEDFETCVGLLGVELRQRPFRTMGGDTKTEPSVRWGLYTQGSGASFEGSYRYAKGGVKAITAHTGGSDKELIRIAAALQAVQKKHGYKIEARMTDGTGSNFYPHSGTMAVEVFKNGGCFEYAERETEEEVTQLMRDLADWLYRHIEEEDMYQNADEQVDENIRANEYTFTASGKRFG